MTKQLILTATSKKYGRYCVAGVDMENSSLIRLITTDSDAHYAIAPEVMRYPDGRLPHKLDLVEVECTDRSVSYYQTENYVLARGVPWRKLRRASLEELIQRHPLNQSEMVFYDTARKLHRDLFLELAPREVKSLLLIRPEHTVLLIQQSFDRRQALFEFAYRGNSYEPFPITDLEYLESVSALEAGRHPLPSDPVLLVSVGECFEQDKCHYKLAAGVFL